MSSRTLRVGVAGLGRVSGSHIAAYRAAANAEVVAVCDCDRAIVHDVSSSLGVKAYEDIGTLILDPAIDAVALLLPHQLHYGAAKSALEAGKHVCLEKPMAVRWEECVELIKLASDRRLALVVTQNTRFAAAYIAAKRLIDDGTLGDVHLVRVANIGNEVSGFLSTDPRDAWRRERNGIGALIDCASHYFYLFSWMFGEVSSIQAIVRNVLTGMDAEDYALASGEFADGGSFTVEVCLTAEITWQERMEIHGSRASLIIDHAQDPPAVLYTGWTSSTGTSLKDVPYDPVDWRDASIAAAVDDFLAVATEGRPPTVALRDAAYSVRLVEKAYESAAAGGRRVTV